MFKVNTEDARPNSENYIKYISKIRDHFLGTSAKFSEN